MNTAICIRCYVERPLANLIQAPDGSFICPEHAYRRAQYEIARQKVVRAVVPRSRAR